MKKVPKHRAVWAPAAGAIRPPLRRPLRGGAPAPPVRGARVLEPRHLIPCFTVLWGFQVHAHVAIKF